MKRPLLIISLIVLIAVIIGGAEYTLQRILDRQLPPLLTRELGLPVSISPINADIISLTARAERLQMDGASEPALVAEQVMVSLNWSDLLRGEIRLVTASADNLMVKVAAWPSDDEPLPPDYLFLEPWLPRSIELEQGRYVRADDSEYPVQSARWRRHADGGAELSWREERPAGALAANIRLKSLDDLLRLRLFQADLALTPDGDAPPPSQLAVRIEPGDADTAYRMQVLGTLAGMDGTLEAEGRESWSWPDRSSTHFDTLWADRLADLMALYLSDGSERNLERQLDTRLPRLALPVHEGKITLGELRVGREMSHDNTIRFNSSGNYLALTQIDMQGPTGRLKGSAAVASTVSGWETALAAGIGARKPDQGLLARYIESHWYFRDGDIRLHSSGQTWGQLLYDLTGLVELRGTHRARTETPVALAAKLDGSPRQFALENLSLTLGDSSVTGSVVFSGVTERLLNLKLDSERLNLDFLFDSGDGEQLPGLALPEILAVAPDIDVQWTATVDEMLLPGLELNKVALDIDRGTERGKLTLRGQGPAGGSLEAKLNYESTDAGPFLVTMRLGLEGADVARLFGRRENVLETRTTGHLVFTSQGDGIEAIFAGMRGDADLTVEIRADRDWERERRPEEGLALKGVASLVVQDRRILGIRLDQIDLDAIRQDISGSLSMVADRVPFLVAEFDSERLDLGQIQDWLPEAAEEADQVDLLDQLILLDDATLVLKVKELAWLEAPMTDIVVELNSREKRFDLSKLSLVYKGARLDSSAGLAWQDEIAALKLDGEVSALALDHMLGQLPSESQARLEQPLAGSFTLRGKGRSFTELLSAASGSIKLAAPPPSSDVIDIELHRQPDGVEAQIKRLAWEGSDLSGTLRFQRSTPPALALAIQGRVLDLRPWEEPYLSAQQSAESETSGLSEATEKTGQFVTDFLSYPVRLVKGGNSTPPGERIFSAEPWDLTSFRAMNLHIDGQLDKFYSAVAEGEALTFDVQLDAGVLTADAEAQAVNGGSASATARFDSTTEPPAGDLEILFRGIYPAPDRSTYPRDGHFILNSRGGSEAEMAANLDGMGYLELGRGPVDYGRLAFLTSDAATSVVRTLIPSAATRKPELQCGVTLADFSQGKGVTPYGWAARTRTANLLGEIEVDLEKERIELRFRSRSREGAGISIGNAFSNSVGVSGPLSAPRIVPNAPGLIVRGWAAFMTAGLSVLGESVFNRVLASGNPCNDIRKEIREDLCKSEAPLAKSPLACPTDSEMRDAGAQKANDQEDTTQSTDAR